MQKTRMSKKEEKNVLDYVPVKYETVCWDADENGIVVLHMENKGFFARVAQIAFNRPKVSHITLEKYGSFIWPRIDGVKSIYDIALEVKAEFGEEAEPLYERILQYFRTLYGHNFIKWKKEKC